MKDPAEYITFGPHYDFYIEQLAKATPEQKDAALLVALDFNRWTGSCGFYGVPEMERLQNEFFESLRAIFGEADTSEDRDRHQGESR